MSAINKIRDHFNASIDNNLQKYHCADWDLDIYYYPTYPVKDEMRVMNLQAQNKTMEALIESIVVKSRDAEGKRMFTDADRTTLMHEADPKVIIRVAGVVNAGLISSEEVEKN